MSGNFVGLVAVPSSCEGLLGSSPDLPRKDARGTPLSVLSSAQSESLEHEQDVEIESADFGSFSDVGSSNANRPESADMELDLK